MILSLVTNYLLSENNINYQDVFSILDDISNRNTDYSDLYFQSIIRESWVLEENIIKEGTFHNSEGVGVRIISGESTSFSYSNEITWDSLLHSSKSIINTVSAKNKNNVIVPLKSINKQVLYTFRDPLLSISIQEKIEILKSINIIARKIDHRVVNVNAVLSGVYDQILIAASDGNLAADIRPLVSLSINVLVSDKGKSERGTSGGGSRSGYSFFLELHECGKTLAEYYAMEAVRIALINLSAKEAPAGTFPVVLGPGWPGILLHEAVGHGLEGDFNRQGTSIFANKIGEKVTSELCTIVDNSTIENYRGSLNIDDEGVPGKYNILIQNGILKSYLQDKFNSYLTGTKSTGNGRRESYAHLPLPRMTNTYMLAGNSFPQDIINSVDYGIYALNFSGGQVDITSGKFVFSTSEAYLIKKGKITESIKNAMLIGSGFSSMNEISMIGNDLSIDGGLGTCIKNGQSVPVGVGQPTIKLDNLTIGGTF